MFDSIGQMGLEAYAYPAQARKAGASYADPNALVEPSGEASTAQDRFISSFDKEEYGLYSKESLLQDGAKLGDTVPELDAGDKDLIKRLEQRDREVRKHEQAHAAAAGEFAKEPPTYSYQMGPNGKMYAIGGSIAVDVGKESDAAANMRKSFMLQGAAMGVEDASAADAMVAAQARDLLVEGFSIQA